MSTKVFMQVSIAGIPKDKMVFKLYSKELPKTTENFRALCTGEKGKGRSGKNLHFKNSFFHRIIPEFMAQGGDFTNFNGTGGESIYGQKFNDEGFLFKHTKRGNLSMANAGPNTNSSQFFITFTECPWLNNNHVVFGELIEGHEVLDQIETVGSQSGRPEQEVLIINCGEEKVLDQ